MDLKINVSGIAEVKQNLAKLQSELQNKALAAALNKTAAKASTEMNRAIRGEFRIDAQSVRNSIEIGKARAKSSSGLEAVLRIFGSAKKKGRSLNVVHFMEKSITLSEAKRRSKKGTLFGVGKGGRVQPVLGFKFKTTGGAKQVKGAFIGNKGRTVFVRTGDARLPIKPLQMIGVSQMFSTEKIKRRVFEKINRDIVEETERAVKMVIARHMK